MMNLRSDGAVTPESFCLERKIWFLVGSKKSKLKMLQSSVLAAPGPWQFFYHPRALYLIILQLYDSEFEESFLATLNVSWKASIMEMKRADNNKLSSAEQ